MLDAVYFCGCRAYVELVSIWSAKYDEAKFWASNGSAAGGEVLFAVVTAGLTLTASDFIVI
jgi:hypothetical protein